MAMSWDRFVGLDIETTGSNIEDGHRIIQLGLARQGPDGVERWSSLVMLFPEDPWEEEAAAVHKIPRESLADAPQSPFVEADAMKWLGDPIETRFAIGFNVAGFDMRFIREQMPALGGLFSYRTVDLNAIIFALALGTPRGYDGIKKRAKDWAAKRIGGDTNWHDAGYDAAAALECLRYLSQCMGVANVLA